MQSTSTALLTARVAALTFIAMLCPNFATRATAQTPVTGATAHVDRDAITGATVNESLVTVVLHVDPVNGDDANNGTSAGDAVRTLQRAMQLVLTENRSNNGVKLLLHDGEYRTADDFIDIVTETGQTDMPIVIEAVNSGQARLVGTDAWSGWTHEGGGIYSKAWAYNWGEWVYVADWVKDIQGTGGTLESPNGKMDGAARGVARRREMVFIDDALQLPTAVSLNDLAGGPDGRFYVDEANDKVYLKPGFDPNSVTVEVAVRPNNIWDGNGNIQSPIYIEDRDNIVIRGLSIRRFATVTRPVVFLWGRNNPVENVLIEDCDLSENSWNGIDTSGQVFNLTVRDVTANHNGFQGVSGGGSGLDNVVLDGVVANENNWRCILAGLEGWSVGGVKLAALYNGMFIDCVANNNNGNGLWVDLEGENIIFENCTMMGNTRHGLDLEVMQGPVLVKDCVIQDNEQWQVVAAAVEDCTFYNNYIAQGQGGSGTTGSALGFWQNIRTINRWDTDEPLALKNQRWTIANSVFQTEDAPIFHRDGGVAPTNWSTFLDSLHSDLNFHYRADDNNAVFGSNASTSPRSFVHWQSDPGRDANSYWKALAASERPTPINLALNGVASLSSEFAGGVASRVNDGNTDGIWNHGSVAHTDYDDEPYAEIDLGRVCAIEEVVVYNRTDSCCVERMDDFYVLVSDVPFTSDDLDAVLSQNGVRAYFHAGSLGDSDTIGVHTTGRYVRVQRIATDYMNLAEIEVIGVPGPVRENLALNATPSASSSDFSTTPARLIDNNTSGTWPDGTIHYTHNTQHAYVELDLGEVKRIDDIHLWNRTDTCCNQDLANFSVFVSDDPFVSTDPNQVKAQSGVIEFYHPGVGGDNVSIYYPTQSATGRYVRVQIWDTSYLVMAELQVYGGDVIGLVDRTDETGAIITARGENAPHEDRTKLLDNDVYTKWLDYSATSWVQHQFGNDNAYTIVEYTLTSANDVPERDPLNWTLKGSNDGVNWATLDTRSGEEFANRHQTKTYTISNATPYRLYRFDFENNWGGITQLAEIELFGREDNQGNP